MAVIDRQVAANLDDCDKYSGALHVDPIIDVWLSHESYDMEAGFRFLDMQIAQGATINSAKLTLYCIQKNAVDGTVTWKGEDADDAATFSTLANFDGRPRTSASEVDTPMAWTVNDWNDTVDLSSIVQEIVDRVGWVPGNAMVFFSSSLQGAGQGQRNTRAYDNTPANSAKFQVDYTASAGVTMKKGSCVPAMTALLSRFSALKQPREPKFQPRTFPKFTPRTLI